MSVDLGRLDNAALARRLERLRTDLALAVRDHDAERAKLDEKGRQLERARMALNGHYASLAANTAGSAFAPATLLVACVNGYFILRLQRDLRQDEREIALIRDRVPRLHESRVKLEYELAACETAARARGIR